MILMVTGSLGIGILGGFSRLECYGTVHIYNDKGLPTPIQSNSITSYTFQKHISQPFDDNANSGSGPYGWPLNTRTLSLLFCNPGYNLT